MFFSRRCIDSKKLRTASTTLANPLGLWSWPIYLYVWSTIMSPVFGRVSPSPPSNDLSSTVHHPINTHALNPLDNGLGSHSSLSPYSLHKPFSLQDLMQEVHPWKLLDILHIQEEGNLVNWKVFHCHESFAEDELKAFGVMQEPQ